MTSAVWRFEAIGTVWEIETQHPLPLRERQRVTAVIDRFDREWSRFRDDSVVRSLEGGGATDAPPDAAAMFEVYAELSDATGGAVDPLVGSALEALGYDAAYSLRGGEPEPRTMPWRDIVSWTGGELRLRRPGLLDVGALGKGRLVDLVADEIHRTAPGAAVVDAGGDIRVSGATERIGLEHPYDLTRAIGVWEVTDAALCASAVNRRAWGDGLHHVLDARTGLPVRTIAATWAVASTAMLADAASTALFFDGGPALAHAWGVEWVRMTTDGAVEWSPGCSAELFSRRDSVDR